MTAWRPTTSRRAAAVAGVVLIGLAAWIPFPTAARAPRTASSRWAIRALVVAGRLLAAIFVLVPVGIAIVDIHSLHRPSAPRRAPRTETSRSRAPTASASRAGTARRATAPRCSMSPAAAATARAPSATRGCSCATATACSSTTPRQRQQRGQSTPTAGVGEGRAGGARLPRSAGPTSSPAASAPSACRPAPTSRSTSPRRRATSRAVVADGAAAAIVRGLAPPQGTTAMTPFFWSQFAARGSSPVTRPGRPLADLVPRIAAPMLLISTERHRSTDFNVKYARLPAAGPSIGTSRRAAHARSARPPARVRAAGRRFLRPRPGLNGPRPLRPAPIG